MNEITNLILESGIFEINFEKPFRFSSGKLYPVYCDNRGLLSMPKQRERIISAMSGIINKHKIGFSVISGIETASIPWASMLAFKLNKPLIYVRKEEKLHGKKKRIEGRYKKNDKVLLIEDLVSTGGSAISAIKALRKAGLIVDYCLGIFTYNIGDAVKKFENIGVKLITFTDVNEVLELAVRKKILNERQRIEILKVLR